METWVKLASIITPVIILLGIWYARIQIVSNRNTRRGQILIQLWDNWDSIRMQNSRQMINIAGTQLKQKIETADSNNSDDLYQYVMVANFFDCLGGLVREGCFCCKIAYDNYGRAEEHYFEKYRPILENEQYKDYLKNFRELHDLFVNEKAKRSKSKAKSDT
jgi:hypothetical protein